MDVTKHQNCTKQEPIYTCSITVRDFPPTEDFVVRWEFPILVRDDQGLDPADLKRPTDRGGRPPGDTEDRILVALRTAECVAGLPGLTVSEIEKATGTVRRTIYEPPDEPKPVREPPKVLEPFNPRGKAAGVRVKVQLPEGFFAAIFEQADSTDRHCTIRFLGEGPWPNERLTFPVYQIVEARE